MFFAEQRRFYILLIFLLKIEQVTFTGGRIRAPVSTLCDTARNVIGLLIYNIRTRGSACDDIIHRVSATSLLRVRYTRSKRKEKKGI